EQDLAERECGERRLRSRLEDARAAGCKRGGDFVRDEQQRCVEGGDPEDGADGEAFGEADPALAARNGIDRNDLPRGRYPARLVGGHREDLDRSSELSPRLPERETGLQRHLPGELGAALGDEAGGSCQDLGALERRHRGDRVLRRLRRSKRLLDNVLVGQPDGGDLGTVVGIDYVLTLARSSRYAG